MINGWVWGLTGDAVTLFAEVFAVEVEPDGGEVLAQPPSGLGIGGLGLAGGTARGGPGLPKPRPAANAERGGAASHGWVIS